MANGMMPGQAGPPAPGGGQPMPPGATKPPMPEGADRGRAARLRQRNSTRMTSSFRTR